MHLFNEDGFADSVAVTLPPLGAVYFELAPAEG